MNTAIAHMRQNYGKYLDGISNSYILPKLSSVSLSTADISQEIEEEARR